MMHLASFWHGALEGLLCLGAETLEWAVPRSLVMLPLVRHCLDDRFQVNSIQQKLSVQCGRNHFAPEPFFTFSTVVLNI